jgi:hypothetical protein
MFKTTPMNTPACILFLDFDGVTHPEVCTKPELFQALPLIEAVVREHVHVEIVISSTWRLHHTFSELQSLFAKDMASRVVGVTPSFKRLSGDWLPNGLEDFSRECECVNWLRQNRPGAHWLAIDDIDHWFRPGCSDLLLTDPTEGFLPSDQARLASMIQERLP